jgi:hypothetical protein
MVCLTSMWGAHSDGYAPHLAFFLHTPHSACLVCIAFHIAQKKHTPISSIQLVWGGSSWDIGYGICPSELAQHEAVGSRVAHTKHQAPSACLKLILRGLCTVSCSNTSTHLGPLSLDLGGHATCNMQHATCNMQHAACSMQHAKTQNQHENQNLGWCNLVCTARGSTELAQHGT